MKKPAGAFVDAKSPFEVENEAVQFIQPFDHIAQEHFRCGEVEMPLQLVNGGSVASFPQDLVLGSGPYPARSELRTGGVESNDGLTQRLAVKQVEV